MGAEGGAPGNLRELGLGLWSLGVPDEASKPRLSSGGPGRVLLRGAPSRTQVQCCRRSRGPKGPCVGVSKEPTKLHRRHQRVGGCHPQRILQQQPRGGPPCPYQVLGGSGTECGEQHSRRPRAQLAPRVDASISPHCNDVETEAQGRAGIPKSCSASLWPPTLPQPNPLPQLLLRFPHPLPVSTAGVHSTGGKSHPASCQLRDPGQATQPLCAATSLPTRP